jgi:hypothetical protein
MKFRVELEAIESVEVEAETREDAEDYAILEAEKYKPHWYTVAMREVTNVGS